MIRSGARLLVAGVGNIFLADDAFGPEVIRALEQRPLPAEVRVRDFGIRGLDLAYELLDGYDVAVLVDAAERGHRPGTLSLIEPDLPDGGSGAAPPEAHGMDRRRSWPWPPTWATDRCRGSSSSPANPTCGHATTRTSSPVSALRCGPRSAGPSRPCT